MNSETVRLTSRPPSCGWTAAAFSESVPFSETSLAWQHSRIRRLPVYLRALRFERSFSAFGRFRPGNVLFRCAQRECIDASRATSAPSHGEEVGRPFAEEIRELEETYRWACGVAVEPLSQKITRLSSRPLFAVGSGGSLTTATIAAGLFSDFGQGFSSAVTPLDLVNRRASVRGSSVFIAAAGGSNPDVVGALRVAAKSEAAHVLALCASVGSRLADESSKFSNVSIEEFESPSRKDGFLATNSLLASAVLLTRAFAAPNNISVKLPKQLHGLVGARRWQTFVNSLANKASDLWRRDTLIVLYGPTAQPAAVDLESKLTEAALSNVWMADYRHFAHGRHHWLAKRGSDSSVIAFVSSGDREIAERTLEQIPNDVPRLVIELPDGPLAALANVFPIIRSAGLARGIDPGRPGVPSFGRRIYKLNAFGRTTHHASPLPPLEAVAIERKSQKSIAHLDVLGELNFWQTAYANAVARISKGRYSAIVFDYDGTLCDPSERFTGPRATVLEQLRRLVKSGVLIGVATGRGKSVREDLRKAIPKKYWPQVTIGYYNGGQIGTLREDGCPDGTPSVSEALSPVLSALQSNARLPHVATVEGRLKQITVSAKSPTLAEECWHLTAHIVHLTQPAGIKLVRSSHSFDLLSAEVTKLAVIARLSARENGSDVLTIGDMGRWPGNDHELLSHPHSLSVNQVSPDHNTCWNLASPGVHGVQATLELLTRIRVNTKGTARLVLPHALKKGHK